MTLGLFGGTFDPVHNAHLFVAEAARDALGLERVVFLPTRAGFHRRPPLATLEDRLAMLRAALATNVHFALDETDLAPDASGYTADLLPRLRARYPGDRFVFIAGGDSLLASPWQRFDDVLSSLDAFAIAPRAGAPELESFLEELTPRQRAKMTVLDSLPALRESATLIRSLVARNATIRYLVPDAVYRYIAEHALYKDALTSDDD